MDIIDKIKYGEAPDSELTLAEKIVKGILKDFRGRRGLRQEFDSIDEDIQIEIIESWIKITEKELE